MDRRRLEIFVAAVTPEDSAKLNEALGALSKQRAHADAIAADLVTRYPDEPQVRVAAAAARSLMQDYAGAVRHLDIAAALADSANIQFNLGYCHRQCGDYERGAVHLRKSLVMPGGESAGTRALAANTFDIVGRHDEAARLLDGAAETPILAFARWLLDREGARERTRMFFAADPAGGEEATLFWMKYDCHLFGALDSKAQLAHLMNAEAAKRGAIAQFWPEAVIIELPPLKGEGRIARSNATKRSGEGSGDGADRPPPDALRESTSPFQGEEENKWWLFKPSALSGGQGMRFTRDPASLDPNTPGIAQRYVDPPFLILGRKFNLRLFLCFHSVDPLEMYLWHDGLVFVSTEPYAAPDTRAGDTPNVRHVVNLLRANEKDTAQPLGPFEAHIMPLETLLALDELGPNGGARMRDGIIALGHAIKDALVSSGFTARLKQFPNARAFPARFVGLDVGFDAGLNPRLFEIERYPGLGSGEGKQRSEINTRFRRQWMPFALAADAEKDEHFQRF